MACPDYSVGLRKVRQLSKNDSQQILEFKPTLMSSTSALLKEKSVDRVYHDIDSSASL